MADHIHIENLHPYNGDWPLEIDTITNRELHTIKDISGVRANELEQALEAWDNDLVVAFAEIALRRAGLRVERDRLWDAPVGAISLVFETEEVGDGEVPPAEPLPNEPASRSEGGEKPTSSGASSSNGGGHPANVPSPTGTPASATGAMSDLGTLAT